MLVHFPKLCCGFTSVVIVILGLAFNLSVILICILSLVLFRSLFVSAADAGLGQYFVSILDFGFVEYFFFIFDFNNVKYGFVSIIETNTQVLRRNGSVS